MKKYDDKYTKCPACGSDGIQFYHSDLRTNTIYKCEQCKVQFMNPVYSNEYLDEYYSRYVVLDKDKDITLTSKQAYTINDNFKAIEKCIKTSGEMLDFGIGNGTHARVARERGWQVRGYDVDCVATEILMEKSGTEVKCGDFFNIDWGEQKFDLIYINQVMEHIKTPVRYLEHFYKLLNEKGHLFITVPNINSTSNRLKYLLEKAKIRKKNIGKYYDSDHHVIYYSPVALKYILQKNGYEVLYSRNCVKPKVDSPALWQFISNNILEQFYSTSTFMMIARKR